jgi:hypothetical protein
MTQYLQIKLNQAETIITANYKINFSQLLHLNLMTQVECRRMIQENLLAFACLAIQSHWLLTHTNVDFIFVMHAKRMRHFGYEFCSKFSKSQSEEKPQLQLDLTPHSPRDVKQIQTRPCAISTLRGRIPQRFYFCLC